VGWVVEQGAEAVGCGGRQWDVVGCGGMWWEEERWVTWQRKASTNNVCSACRNCQDRGVYEGYISCMYLSLCGLVVYCALFC
jgi:hypothetical protein